MLGKNAKILILGGTGAMGVSLTSILENNGYEVYVTSRSDRKSEGNIHYIKGNAHDSDFISLILRNKYEAIVDFMKYDISELTYERINLLLSSTEHYIFLSSARVYGNSNNPITEKTSRLLECVNDSEYLKTNEYALLKAREEDILKSFSKKNWTIIRPYITYNIERLQLGVLEKENWLYRVLHGRSILFFKDISEHFTTMTYGYDLAFILSRLICNPQTFGETYHITTYESIKWKEILEIYKEVLRKKLGVEPHIEWIEKAEQIKSLNKYQIKYCRLFDRKFDNSKVMKVLGEEYKFIPVKEGLKRCLEQFIDEKRNFKNISWYLEAKFDKLTNESTPLSEIPGIRNKITYILNRFTPYQRIRPSLAKLKHRLFK